MKLSLFITKSLERLIYKLYLFYLLCSFEFFYQNLTFIDVIIILTTEFQISVPFITAITAILYIPVITPFITPFHN